MLHRGTTFALLLIIATMLLLRSSAFIVRGTVSRRPFAFSSTTSRGIASSSSSSARGRGHLSASVDLGGSVMTRLDKAEDLWAKPERKDWDYVAHHPRYVYNISKARQ